MTVQTITGTAVAFDRFWSWLKLHPTCILEASAPDATLHDHELMHWVLFEDEERRPVVHLVLGKNLVAELLIDAPDILFVQGTPQNREDGMQDYLFEVMAGTAEDSRAVYRFIVAHGLDDGEGHRLADAQ